MTAGLHAGKFIAGAACHHFLAEVDKRIQKTKQSDLYRTLVDNCYVVVVVVDLQICIFKEIIQNHLRVAVLADINDDPQTFSVGFITNIQNAVDFLAQTDLIHLFDQIGLDDFIRHFGYDNLIAGTALQDFCFSTDYDSAVPSFKRLLNAFRTLNDAAGRKIRPRNQLHYFFKRAVRVMKPVDCRIDRFREIVRRHICRIACRNTGRTIYQHDRKRNRQYGRFIFRIIKVRCHFNGVFIEVIFHDLRYFGKTHFGVTHGSCRVIIDGTVVAMHVDQRKADLPVLRHTHHRIINGGITMRVVVADDKTDCLGRFAIGMVPGVSIVIHRIENTALHRFQSVTGIRQCTFLNNIFGIPAEPVAHDIFKQ